MIRRVLDRMESPVPMQRVPWIWVFLAVAVAVPFPAFGWPLPERAVPIMWLMLAGAGAIVALISRVSIPYAAILAWGIVRAAYHAYPERSLKVLLLMAMAGLLYLLARETTDKMARTVAVAICIGAGWEGLLGLVNAFGYYPWMAFIVPEHIGKPMGFLTHPNYWGSFMALCLPVIWAVCGIPAALVVYLLILKTISAGPVIAASFGVLVMAWPLFGKRVRIGVMAGGAAGILGTLILHEFRLSGRLEIWRMAVPEILRWPIMGQGVGQWRQWAEDWDQAHYAPQAGKHFLVTLQAHNEAYQLLFELGLVGLLLGALWVVQAGYAAQRVWRAAPASRLPSPWYAWGRAPLERAWIAVVATALVNSFGSPVFHLPAQAALVLFALARMQADAAAFSERTPIELHEVEVEDEATVTRTKTQTKTKTRRPVCRAQ